MVLEYEVFCSNLYNFIYSSVNIVNYLSVHVLISKPTWPPVRGSVKNMNIP